MKNQYTNKGYIKELASLKKTVSLTVSILALGTSTSVGAQNNTNAEEDAFVLEEIIVTARKRSESLQNVPLSVSAISEQALTSRNIDDFVDYVDKIPNVGITDFGPTGFRGAPRQISIRGIAPGASDLNATGIYLDEHPFLYGDPKLFDVSRVEVLRGPQGTLYGLGTSAGAIKIVTNQPNTESFEAAVSFDGHKVDGGEWGGHFNGMLNIPIAEDKVALRIVASHREEAGYIDQVALPASLAPFLGAEAIVNTAARAGEEDVNDETTTSLRAQLKINVSDSITVTPSVYYNHTRADTSFGYDSLIGDLVQAREVDTFSEESNLMVGVRADVDLGFADLTSITTYFKHKNENVEDLSNLTRSFFAVPFGASFPGSAPMVVTGEAREFIQEVRLTSSGDSKLQWLIGGYYQDTEAGTPDGKDSLSLVAPGSSAALPFFPILDDTLFRSLINDDAREISVFGEVSYDITDKLTATFGLRYFDVEKIRVTDRGGLFAGIPLLAGNLPVIQASDENGLRPKIGLSYQVTDDHMVYALASSGFRRGGGNSPAPILTCGPELDALGLTDLPLQFDADKIWNYEAGAKTTWADGRLVVNASAFYIDWSDIQQLISLTCGAGFIDNVGDARSVGAEIEIFAKPLDGLDVDFSAGYNDAEITSIPTEVAGFVPVIVGDRLEGTPKWSFSSNAQYSWEISGDMTMFARAEYSYTGSKIERAIATSSYDVANFRAGVRGETWSATLYMENAFDSRPQLGLVTFGTTVLNPEIFTIRPRTFGVSFRKDFF